MAQYNFATANLSFAFAMGATIGSEAKWLKKILEEAKAGDTPTEVFEQTIDNKTDKEYLQARSKDVMGKIINKIASGKIDAIGLQELNHSTKFGDEYIKTELKDYLGFYQHVKVAADGLEPNTVPKKSAAPKNELKTGGGNIAMISLSVLTGGKQITIALIYNMEKLGKPDMIEGRDFHNISSNSGRPMLGVRTKDDFVLMVMHAPNVNPFLNNYFATKATTYDKHVLNNYYMKKKVPHDLEETISALKEKIETKIKNGFMDPMEEQIKNFINAIKQGKESEKLVLMGDMNDTDPGEEMEDARSSLSNWLKTNVGLEFSVPEHGTCCYNWDSSKSQTPDPTRWWIGNNSYPDDKINNKALEQVYGRGESQDKIIKARVNAILAEKAQLQNYDFKGDLIYYSNNLDSVGGQRELFPQDNRELTSQYSDHVFQVITLKDKGSSGGGRKRTLKRKGKKTRKRRHKRKMTKRKKMKKRRSRKHRSR
jgi:hypothetical protein